MSRKVFEKRKKEICIGAIGVALLAGVGVSIGYMSNGVANDTKTSVVDKVIDKDKNKTDKEIANIDKEKNEVENEVTGNTTEEGVENTDAVVSGGDSASATTEESETTSDNTSKDTGSESKPSTGGGSTSNNTGSNSNSKPSNGGGSSNTGGSSNSKPSNGGSSNNGGTTNGGGTSKPDTHTHNWVAVTEQVHHDEQGHWEEYVVSQAWTEEVPVYEEQARSICNGCGKDITGNTTAHIKEQALAGNYACGGYHVEYNKVQTGTNKIEHPAVTDKKWVVDKAAWTETVTTGYKCSGCGATK